MNRADMEERLVDFAVRCANLHTHIKASNVGSCYGLQLVRSSSSVGANYAEATHARSDADFIAKLKIAEGEAAESRHWLRTIARVGLVKEGSLDQIIDESNQLIAILHATAESRRKNTKYPRNTNLS